MRRLGAMCLTAVFLWAVGPAYSQTRPDFSGKWNEIAPAAGQSPKSMVVQQDANTITVDVPPDQRWSMKLDGSPSTNVNIQDRARVEHVVTATWDGAKLTTSTRALGKQQTAMTIRQVWSLDGNHLVIASTITDDATGAILQDVKQTFSK